MITLEEFNQNAYFSTVAYIDDILSISPDQWRGDFVLYLDDTGNVQIDSNYWDVGITQPTILQICEALTMERVNACISALTS
jgi:hypothetical protein